MTKKLFFVSAFILSVIVVDGRDPVPHSSVNMDEVSFYPQSSNIVSHFTSLSLQQLYDTANYYFRKNSTDTALICFYLLIATTPKTADIEYQKRAIRARNRSAMIYFFRSDYRKVYELLVQKLILSEKINDTANIARAYINIGNIYYRFSQYEIAKSHYLKALAMSKDSTDIVGNLNNIGIVKGKLGDTNSAFYFLNNAMELSKRHNNHYLHNILHDIALIHHQNNNYQAAYHYYQLSLAESRRQNSPAKEAETQSQLGKLFFETGKINSALSHIDSSNAVAQKHGFLGIQAANYLLLSKIERSRGRKTSALEYFEKHANLNHTILSAEKIGSISHLRNLHEISKINDQIEQLVIKQQVKEQTIRYQKIIQYIALVVLLLISTALLILFFQKRKLNTAYKVLFEKSLEIIDFQENTTGERQKKYKKSALTQDMQEELLDKILAVMEDSSIICDPKFSVLKLAELVQSNEKYVSQAINTVFEKNFRPFLNSYRIRIAQRLFSDFDPKYTIDSVALTLGYKSPNTFRSAFQEITGVSPNFYLKSLRPK